MTSVSYWMDVRSGGSRRIIALLIVSVEVMEVIP